jgi:D-xylono/L-arabinono-1,4-lactonase
LINPVVVASHSCITGEGPLWHPDDQQLYWTDIPSGIVYRYDPASGNSEIAYRGAPVGGMTLQEDGRFLFFMEKGAIARWDRHSRNNELHYLIRELPLERNCRFNDVIADPLGRVFCGTTNNTYDAGRLYCLDTDGSIHLMFETGLSNGMGFAPDGTGFYHIDSTARTITRYDYDQASGSLGNPHLVIQAKDGMPDGMTVDSEGYLWIAFYQGGMVIRSTPQGEIVQRIPFPVKHTTSLTFANPHHDTLYITTAKGDRNPDSSIGAGALFRLNVGVSGIPEFRSKIQFS